MKKILLIIFIFSVIYGDVMYEMETKSTGIMGLGDNVMTIRNFIKSDRMRTEMKPQSSEIDNGTFAAIIRLDKGVIWILNLENKDYVEIPLEESGERISDSTVTPEFKIEKLEETKEILNIKCEKYSVSIKINSEGEKMEITQTMWMGREFPGYNEIKELNNKIQGRTNEKGLLGIDNKLFRDLQRRISEIDGFPLEMEIDVKMQSDDSKMELKSTSIIKKIATVPISDKVFEIPEGYIPAKTPDTD
uniref:DUF4412 domain-containing protein n=1 Tax=candidate division WOR-3 bacterium TaxID=2052148 RepID=A0A7V0Z751_UNCW3